MEPGRENHLRSCRRAWRRIQFSFAASCSFALLAAAATLLSIAPSRADGCNIGDVFQAAANTAGALTSAACTEAGQIGEGAGYGLAAAVAAGLGVVQANSGPGSVDNLCNDLNAGQSGVASIGQWLATAGISQDVTGTILALGGPALSVVECGCSLEQGVDQLVSDVSACLCDLVSWIPGVNCNNCTPPPPVQANCALSTTCFDGSSDPACQMNNTLPGCSSSGPFGTTICPSSEQDGSTGAFVSEQIGDPNCPTLLYCFCPKPLVPTWTSVPPLPGSFNNPSYSGVFTCACPDGSSQAGTAGGIPICLCDYTHQPPKVGDTAQDRCPFNLLGQPCPKSGQIRVGNKCVAPCSSPNEVMTPDGVCCDPNQVTYCGQCCPSGMMPNLVSGTCGPSQVTQ